MFLPTAAMLLSMLKVCVYQSCKIVRARAAALQPPQWRVWFWFVVRHFENRMAGSWPGSHCACPAVCPPYLSHFKLRCLVTWHDAFVSREHKDFCLLCMCSNILKLFCCFPCLLMPLTTSPQLERFILNWYVWFYKSIFQKLWTKCLHIHMLLKPTKMLAYAW